MSKKGKAKISDLMRREQNLAYRLLIPTALAMFLTAFYPLGSVFYTSLTNKRFASSQETEFVGLSNYIQLLSVTIKALPVEKDASGNDQIDSATGKKVYAKPGDVLPTEPKFYKKLTTFNLFGKRYVIGATDPVFLRSIYNTVIFTVIAVSLETLIGLFIALVVNSKFKGQGVMRAVMLVPWAIITVVSARIWDIMLLPSRQGLFNSVLDQYFNIGGGNISFFTTEALQMPAIIAIDVWKTSPFMALLILAGLQLIPQDMYKAADVDGAGPVKKFFSITLPLLKPSIAVALIFRTLDSLRIFDLFQVLLANKKYSMATYNYELLIQSKEMGMASAVGVIIFIIIAAAAIMYTRALGVSTDE